MSAAAGSEVYSVDLDYPQHFLPGGGALAKGKSGDVLGRAEMHAYGSVFGDGALDGIFDFRHVLFRYRGDIHIDGAMLFPEVGRYRGRMDEAHGGGGKQVLAGMRLGVVEAPSAVDAQPHAIARADREGAGHRVQHSAVLFGGRGQGRVADAAQIAGLTAALGVEDRLVEFQDGSGAVALDGDYRRLGFEELGLLVVELARSVHGPYFTASEGRIESITTMPSPGPSSSRPCSASEWSTW